MLRGCMSGYACFFVRTVAREHEVVGMFGYACFIEACFLSAVAAQRLGCCCIVCCRSTVWLLLHCRPRHSTVVAADDAVGAVVWAGAAFKSPDASSAVSIAAVS